MSKQNIDTNVNIIDYKLKYKSNKFTVFENYRKRSHSTLRAKRAPFTFWVAKSSLKMPKTEVCVQTVLPAKNFKWDIFGHFQTMWSFEIETNTRVITGVFYRKKNEK